MSALIRNNETGEVRDCAEAFILTPEAECDCWFAHWWKLAGAEESDLRDHPCSKGTFSYAPSASR
jgi:hypothetical protein